MNDLVAADKAEECSVITCTIRESMDLSDGILDLETWQPVVSYPVWKDVPDTDSDAFVYFDSRDGYIVSLEGLTWNGSMLKSYQRFPDSSWRTFPTRDIATYELARAMSHAGCFPNAWYQDERGWNEDIGGDVRKYHDHGGDKMLPLEGVEYAQSQDVTAREDASRWYEPGAWR